MNNEDRELRNLRVAVEARCLASLERINTPRCDRTLGMMADRIERGCNPMTGERVVKPTEDQRQYLQAMGQGLRGNVALL